MTEPPSAAPPPEGGPAFAPPPGQSPLSPGTPAPPTGAPANGYSGVQPLGPAGGYPPPPPPPGHYPGMMPPGSPMMGHPAGQSTNVLCIVGFVASLLWTGLLGLILSIVGVRQAGKRGQGGKALGIAGIVLGALGLLGHIFFFGLLGAAINSAENDKPKISGQPSAPSNEKPAEGAAPGAQPTAKVGQDVTVGKWQIKVHKVTDPLPGGAVFQPQPGTRWVAVESEVTNKSGSPQTVSSLMCFDVRDSTNRKFNITIMAENGNAGLNGQIAPGQSLRGTETFEVAQDSKGLVMNFKCDILGTGTAAIALQ